MHTNECSYLATVNQQKFDAKIFCMLNKKQKFNIRNFFASKIIKTLKILLSPRG